MNSNKKQKSTLIDKKDLKVVKFFKSQLSKQTSQNKSKYCFKIKDKILKGNINSQSNNSINHNIIQSKITTQKEKNIKTVSPKDNSKILKSKEIEKSKKRK